MKCKYENPNFVSCLLCKVNPEKVVCDKLCPHENVHFEVGKDAYWCSDCNQYVEVEDVQERINQEVEMFRTFPPVRG